MACRQWRFARAAFGPSEGVDRSAPLRDGRGGCERGGSFTGLFFQDAIGSFSASIMSIVALPGGGRVIGAIFGLFKHGFRVAKNLENFPCAPVDLDWVSIELNELSTGY